MEEKVSPYRRFYTWILWGIIGVVVLSLYLFGIQPNAATISLTGKTIWSSIKEIGGFLIGILAGLALIEVYVYQWFFTQPRTLWMKIVTRVVQVAIAIFVVLAVLAFFEATDLFRLGEGALAQVIRFPNTVLNALSQALIRSKMVTEATAGLPTLGIFGLVFLALLVLVHFLSKPRHSNLGLAYLLVTPALIGVLFLIIYPFLFEIKLAFSNASLGTKATKEALYGWQYGWDNLVMLFTGTVTQSAKFFEIFGRTVLWTAINVFFHVAGGMGLALLLHRPMKLQGFYRTLLIFPWAIPTTIAAMALRNEFDNRYGLFNIVLGDLHTFFVNLATSVPFLDFLTVIGPVSWKQDPFWAFVSILISNIWLGIPFMSVIILGGLQSISNEYYEAAEIDGASKFHQFRHITMPLLRPVLTPAVILGVVWTFNKFDVIYLITQGGPQEKTDILVSSMYKAAFQFYRYGFTAMFALVIFFFLFLFTLFYLRISGGLKSISD
jgi:arabinogalactan oligomer/maltooligosaccharide transport system permease protein